MSHSASKVLIILLPVDSTTESRRHIFLSRKVPYLFKSFPHFHANEPAECVDLLCILVVRHLRGLTDEALRKTYTQTHKGK